MTSTPTPGKVVIVDASDGYRRTLEGLVDDLDTGGILAARTPNEVLAALVAAPPLLCGLVSMDLEDDGGRRAAESLWLMAPKTPVLFFTGRSGLEFDETTFPAPVALLTKPLRSWDLRATLARLRRRPPRAPAPELPFDL